MMMGKIDSETAIDLDHIQEIQVRQVAENQWQTKYIYLLGDASSISWDVYHATAEEAWAQIAALYGERFVSPAQTGK